MAWAAEWMLWIAGFQFVAGLATIVLLGWTVRETRRTANAAVDSARIARNVGRPYFLIPNVSIDPGFVNLSTGNYVSLPFKMTLECRGANPAFLESISLDTRVVDSEAEPSADNIFGFTSGLDGEPIEHKQRRTFGRQMDTVSGEDWDRAKRDERDIYIVGVLRYRDLQDATRRMGFLYLLGPRADPVGCEGVRSNRRLWYDREETEADREEWAGRTRLTATVRMAPGQRPAQPT